MARRCSASNPTTETTGEPAGGKDAPAGEPGPDWDRAALRQFCKDQDPPIPIARAHSNGRILQLIREWQQRQKLTERVEPLAPGEDES